MKFTIWMLRANTVSAMLAGVWAQQLDYADSLASLSYGNVAMQGNSSGTVWLNTTGFAVDKLPYIQDDLGIRSLDNLEPLKILANLAGIAASKGQYGDLVYLYNAFAMNGHGENIKVSSPVMQRSLLAAVTPANSTLPDQGLIKLYADTSSSPYISEAFLRLQNEVLSDNDEDEDDGDSTAAITPTTTTSAAALASLEKRSEHGVCMKAHEAPKSACRALISQVSGDVTIKSGGPRDHCLKGCCISWSTDATFEIRSLTNAANRCMHNCATTSGVSCKMWGVNLQGTIVNQCLWNTAKFCK